MCIAHLEFASKRPMEKNHNLTGCRPMTLMDQWIFRKCCIKIHPRMYSASLETRVRQIGITMNEFLRDYSFVTLLFQSGSILK